MRYSSLCAVVLTAVFLRAGTASAQLVFGYEPGEPGLPYAGNPASYTTTTTTSAPFVTQGARRRCWSWPTTTPSAGRPAPR